MRRHAMLHLNGLVVTMTSLRRMSDGHAQRGGRSVDMARAPGKLEKITPQRVRSSEPWQKIIRMVVRFEWPFRQLIASHLSRQRLSSTGIHHSPNDAGSGVHMDGLLLALLRTYHDGCIRKQPCGRVVCL